MGCEVTISPAYGIRILGASNLEEVKKLKITLENELDYVYESVYLTRHRFNGVVPLFGFTGGPWTLFSFMLEGGSSKEFLKAKKFLYNHT